MPVKNLRHHIIVFGLAAICAIATQVAVAGATGAQPIQVNNVEIGKPVGNNINYAYPPYIAVSFTNTNAIPATDVIFDIRNAKGRIVRRFHAKGTFTQGAPIHYRFNDPKTNKKLTVAVEKATFSDGSVWPITAKK